MWAVVSAAYPALLSSSYFERINDDDDGYPTNISDYRIGYALYVLSEYELVRESMIHEYAEKGKCDVSLPVSYTHLTLPTIYSV